MLNLCHYKHILGKPNTGLHSHRLFNISIVDVLLTLLLAYFIKVTFFVNKNYYIILFFCFVIGIISHRLFCVRTTIDKFLF